MSSMRVRRRSDPRPADPPAPGLELAWRGHQAIQDWTKSVDQKASIVLVFATALAGVAARDALAKDGALAPAHALTLRVGRAMGPLCPLAAVHALAVVL